MKDENKIHILTQEDIDKLNAFKDRREKLLSYYECLFKIGYKVIEINQSVQGRTALNDSTSISLSFHLAHDTFPDIHENMILDPIQNEIRDFLVLNNNRNK